MFTVFNAELTSASAKPLCVPASQSGLEADDVATRIDPPSSYRPGWYPAREQCLGAVSLSADHRQVFTIDLNKISPRTRPEEGWSP
jgi:hypothetical protein